MTLHSAYEQILASCVHVPQYDVFYTEIGEFQFKAHYGVNKSFYRSWSNLTLKWDAPSPPALSWLRIYETLNFSPEMTPLISVGGFIATCATPGTFYGTSDWLWMATLHVVPFGSPGYPVTSCHFQYKGTNLGSVGMVKYPLTPP